MRFLAALALLGALGLGSACHFWHHLADHECGVDPTHSAPCATCSALHGPALASEPGLTGPPEHTATAEELAPADARLVAIPVMSHGASRAPPQA